MWRAGVFGLLAVAEATAEATCHGAECAGGVVEEEESTLLQLRGGTELVSLPKRCRTRPSDIMALTALYNATGRSGVLLGWGDGDPCYGDAPGGQANAQGFGPWKGVACIPCPEPEDSAYFCVTQIWQHQKQLKGTIPETFRGLTELKWLFLSANNLTGPLPENIWSTFPKLVQLDLSYNQINGNLPLDRMSSIKTLERIYMNDNHLDSVCYFGGGFEKLETLNFMYNRNCSGEFPAAFSEIPNLQTLSLHDTNLTSSKPLPNGPWPKLENLIITGTGNICGPFPAACDEEEVYCDVKYTTITSFPDCPPTPSPTPPSPPTPPTPPAGQGPFVFGTPLAGYHNVTVWVYKLAMLNLSSSLDIKTIILPHPILYPMFLGPAAGNADGECKEDGCPEYCEQEGLGYTSPCIDFVVDSNIPVNHASFGLGDQKDLYDVMGTAFQSQWIGLWAPNYTNWKTIDDAAKVWWQTREIIGWKSDFGDGCNTQYCPKCGSGNLPFVTGEPLGPEGANYSYEAFPCLDFITQMEQRLAKGQFFLALQWIPQAMLAKFPQMVALDMGRYTNMVKPNVGKAQVNKASRAKFTYRQLALLGAIFLGTEEVQRMDGWSHGIDLPAGSPEQLCDYESWDNACSKEAAELWIKKNSNIDMGELGVKQGVYETFFW